MPGSKYERLIEAAAKNAQTVWELADEVLRVCPDRSREQLEAAHEALTEAGYEYTLDRLRTFAYTAERWPAHQRCLETSFKAHEVLNAREDRFSLIRPGMTLTEAHDAAGHSTKARTQLGEGGPTTEIIAAASDDEDTMRSLVGNEQFRDAFLDTYAQEAAQERETQKQAQRTRAPGLTRAHTVASATTDLNRFAAGVGQVLEDLKNEDLSDDHRKQLLARLEQLKNAIGWLEDFLRNGTRSFERELADLLEKS